MKPNFLIIGAAKSGTTTLAHLLGKHPDIYMFPHKEIHFFDLNYDRGIQWYESKFNPPSGIKLIGEATPYMQGNTQLIDRMYSHLPDAKLIFIVRNPLERIESQYIQLMENDVNFGSLEKTIARIPKLLRTSLYWENLNYLQRYYSPEQIMVLFIEELKNNPQRVMDKCAQFLGIEGQYCIEETNTVLNSRQDKAKDITILRWLKKQSFFNDLKWAMPRSIVTTIKPLLKRKMKPTDIEVSWKDSLNEEIVLQVTEDARKFLQAYNKPQDYWSF